MEQTTGAATQKRRRGLKRWDKVADYTETSEQIFTDKSLTKAEKEQRAAIDDKIQKVKLKKDPNRRDSHTSVQLPKNAHGISDEIIRDYIIMLRCAKQQSPKKRV